MLGASCGSIRGPSKGSLRVRSGTTRTLLDSARAPSGLDRASGLLELKGFDGVYRKVV